MYVHTCIQTRKGERKGEELPEDCLAIANEWTVVASSEGYKKRMLMERSKCQACMNLFSVYLLELPRIL